MAQLREANERLVVATVRAQTMTEDAEQANHLKDEFLATGVARAPTPLNAVPMGTNAGVEGVAARSRGTRGRDH